MIPASQSTNKNTPPMTPKHEVTSIESHYKRDDFGTFLDEAKNKYEYFRNTQNRE